MQRLSFSSAAKSLIYFGIYYSGLYYLIDKLFSPNGLYIVGYHRIENNVKASNVHVLAVTRKNLAEHFHYYRRNYEVISMDEAKLLLGNPSKWTKRYLVVTFDDGYRDNYTLGHDLFAEYRIPATIYLTAAPIEERTPLWTDMVDSIVSASNMEAVKLAMTNLKGTFMLASEQDRKALAERIKNDIKLHDEQTKQRMLQHLMAAFETEPPIKDELMIDWQEVHELMKTNVSMGSHTMHHPTLSAISLAQASEELTQSKRLIEARIGTEVRHFAYPYGKNSDFTNDVKHEAARQYDTAVTANNGINGPGQDPWELKRVIVENIGVRKLQFRMLKLKLRHALGKSRR